MWEGGWVGGQCGKKGTVQFSYRTAPPTPTPHLYTQNTELYLQKHTISKQ